jgi:hypothetical protein
MRRLYAIPLILVAALGCRKSAPPAANMDAMAANQAQSNGIKGILLERLDVPSYSYLHIKTGAQEVWAAVPTSTVARGSEVTVVNPMPMKDFKSQALNRTFDVVYFGTLGGPMAAPSMAGGPGAPHPMVMPPQIDMGSQKIEKASGPEARTIAELYAQKDALKEKSVLVRGKVVKYNPNILGKNWVHLRDGSGAGPKGDNDIAITTSDTTALGEVVSARGTVHLNKDFGAGYTYVVILENTKLTK